MSTAPTPPTAPTKPKRARKRIYIPFLLLALLVVIIVGFYVRGTWADTVEKNPSAFTDGTVTQLLRKPDGNVVVRCAVMVDASPREAWAVISDYASHSNFLPYVSEVKAAKQPDGRFQIDGVASSRLWGDWPFQSMATHTEVPDESRYSALWSEEDVDVFKIDRGGWSVSRVGKENHSLIVFTLQVELKDSPNFLVRNVIMNRLPSFVGAMADEIQRRKG